MNVLLAQVSPSALFSKKLRSASLQLISSHSPKPPLDIIVVGPMPTLAKLIAEADRWRKAASNAWIILLTDDAQWEDPDSMDTLLKCKSKNDVWVVSHWENQFWLSLENIRRNQELSKEYQELSTRSKELVEKFEKDVSLASHIQRALLPQHLPQIPGITFSAKYIPAAGPGGDYYDVFEFGDKKHFGILLADSETHGMAASLLSVLVKVRLEEMKHRFPDALSFMEYLNRELHSFHAKDIAPLSLVYGILDRSSLSFRFSQAGHLTPLLWRKGKTTSLTHTLLPSLGTQEHLPFKEEVVQLLPKDLLIFHTDGLDAPLAKTSKKKGLHEILPSSSKAPDLVEIQNEVMGRIDHYQDKKALKDDITFLQFYIHEKALFLATALPQSK